MPLSSHGNREHDLRALVLQHEELTPGGYLTDWLAERGADRHVLRIDAERRVPDPRDYDLVVSLGAEASAYDELPWIEREESLLREAHEADVPVLAICFGAQLLARTLGGAAFRASRPEIGWFTIRSRDEALVPPGPWLQWHSDSFTAPPGAELIAESDVGPQAYTLGRSAGIQFHPEVTAEIVAAWARDSGDQLARHGVQAEALLEETRRMAPRTRPAALRLFDALLARAQAREVVHGG